RGPKKDIHSSNKARVDSPAWHLVEALVTLVSPDGNDPAIDGYADKARPLSPSEKAMIAEAARRLDEKVAKQELGGTAAVQHGRRRVARQDAGRRVQALRDRPGSVAADRRVVAGLRLHR